MYKISYKYAVRVYISLPPLVFLRYLAKHGYRSLQTVLVTLNRRGDGGDSGDGGKGMDKNTPPYSMPHKTIRESVASVLPHDSCISWPFSCSLMLTITLPADLMYSVVITSVIYPVLAHWAWSEHGWASPDLPGENPDFLIGCGAADFAGSGVVHLAGEMSWTYASVHESLADCICAA